VIWLAWRRQRLLLLAALTAGVVLVVWMILVAHWYQDASHALVHGRCLLGGIQCSNLTAELTSASTQATVIGAVLFAAPCLLGVVLGAPLVAAELERRTNRLAWTQSISRTRWLIIKWTFVAVAVVALVSFFQLVTQWWTGQVVMRGLEYTQIPINATNRIQPRMFGITGVAPVAYTLFALALGTALGAVLRRTAWAVLASVVVYAAAASVMLAWVRQHLAATVFVPFSTTPGSGAVSGAVLSTSTSIWNLGSGYRVIPGKENLLGGSSLNAVVGRCQTSGSDLFRCTTAHGLQFGQFSQPGSHYWTLQWTEAGIYVAAAAALLGVTIWAVRRWRA
jgi:hypothetical protein